MNPAEILTDAEAAALQRRSRRTLARERAEGRGCPYIRLGGRILYRRADIDRFLETHLHGGARQPEAARPVTPQAPQNGGAS